jgi:adenosylcobinamide amidohydrolase
MFTHNVSAASRANVFKFHQPADVTSWAIIGGGLQRDVRTVVNRSVTREENIGNCPDEWRQFVRKVQGEVHDRRAIILLTSVPPVACCLVQTYDVDMHVWVYTTVGLGNRFAIGDEIYQDDSSVTGTINIVCIVNQQLTNSAKLEAMHLITLAKASAMMKSGLMSPNNTSEPAIATPTDNIALCSPSRGCKQSAVNAYTRLGYLVMTAVEQSVTLGIEHWIRLRALVLADK